MAVGVFLALCGALGAQMTPNAPVQNFKLPRFGDGGFTQWVLQGERGIYDSEEQVRVDGMVLRIYSGDERMAQELSLDSPQATIRLEENRAFSEGPIRIDGAHFEISGTGWEWLGAPKEIRVAAAARVEFEQAVSAGASPGAGAGRQTTIESDRLMLRTTETEYEFEFTGDVRAASGDWRLTSERLTALADAPRGEAAPGVGDGHLDSVRQIIARDEVVFRQGDRTVRAKEAEFFTRKQRALLRGRPSIELAGAYLTGEQVELQEGIVVIRGERGSGRAQMILLETGGLGLQGAAKLSSETIVLADLIRLEETAKSNRFNFEGAVEVMSGGVQMSADRLTVLSERSSAEAMGTAAAGAPGVGTVSEMIAEGAVRIEREGQVATGDAVQFFPEDSRAVLTGDPRVTNGTAIITGQKMELQPKLAIVRGTADRPLLVELPELPDLGFAGGAANPEGGAGSSGSAKPPESVTTRVRSQLLNMVEEAEQTRFRFSDTVEVEATNLRASCERMDVLAQRKPGASENAAGGAALGIERIEARESLKISQEGRTASAERGTILPKEGKLVLEENAVVEDSRGRVNGFRLTLLQGQRRAIVEGGGSRGERARMTLPGLDAGQFD
ncbi:MAG: LptA/OstA family protein [Opitutales bacterium]